MKWCFIFSLIFAFPYNANAFSGGTGGEGDPWQIATVADLVEVNDYLGADHTDKYFLLTADIDLDVDPYNTGTGWTAIGTNASPFYGQFDGGGYTISNLFASTTADYIGLFGRAFNTTLENLTVSNAQLIGGAQVGVLVGQAGDATITDVIVGGTVTSTGNYLGGMVGRFSSGIVSSVTSSVRVIHNTGSNRNAGGVIGYMDAGSILNARATGNVSGYQRVGGLVGTLSSGVTTVSSSYASGDVSSTGGNLGGFVGNLYAADIYNSYATGNVSTNGSTVGGFFGFGQGTKNLYNVYATGNVEGTSTCGALGAYTEDFAGAGILIQDSYATGAVTCGSRAAGIAAYTNNVTLERVYYAGDLSNSGANERGGLVGLSGGPLTVTDSFWDVDVSGENSTGGAVGSGTSTVAMKLQGTYTNWDFDNTWRIAGANNNGYPYLSYQVYDTTNPTVLTLTPADNATGVTTTANLVIGFDESVIVQSGNIVIYNAADDTVFETIDVTSDNVSGTGTATITINPDTNFVSEASYYVLIDATAFDDASSNSFAGIADNSVWNFTAADEIDPTLSTFAPANGATAVSPTADLIMTFAEAVDAESGTIVIYNASTNAVFETIQVDGVQVSGSGSATITINLASPLAYGETYYVFIDATAFDDSSGNSYTGINSNAVWTFTVQEDNAGGSMIIIPPRATQFNMDDAHSVTSTYGLNPQAYYQEGNLIIESNADKDTVSHIAVSIDDSRFTLMPFESYTDRFVFPLSDTNATSITVYIRYRSTSGHHSVDFVRTVQIDQEASEENLSTPEDNSPIPTLPAVQPSQPIPEFPRALSQGMTGEDVRALQIALNSLGFIVSNTGAGASGEETTYFGSRTFDAVLRFQEAYAADILTPIGLDTATGYVGNMTIRKLLSLLAS